MGLLEVERAPELLEQFLTRQEEEDWETRLREFNSFPATYRQRRRFLDVLKGWQRNSLRVDAARYLASLLRGDGM